MRKGMRAKFSSSPEHKCLLPGDRVFERRRQAVGRPFPRKSRRSTHARSWFRSGELTAWRGRQRVAALAPCAPETRAVSASPVHCFAQRSVQIARLCCQPNTVVRFRFRWTHLSLSSLLVVPAAKQAGRARRNTFQEAGTLISAGQSWTCSFGRKHRVIADQTKRGKTVGRWLVC